jgi:hypothetical protein
MGVRILQAVLQNMSAVEMKTPVNLKPGQEGNRFVKILPAKKSHYIGIVTKGREIQPVTVGGTWYPKRPSPGIAADVILHFHGGKSSARTASRHVHVNPMFQHCAECVNQERM